MKPGAMSKYTPELLAQVKELSRCLYTDKEIYEALDISYDTFYIYKKKYPEFSDALAKGRKETRRTIISAALEKSKTDTYMATFMMKNKFGYMETQQRANLRLKQEELILKQKEFELKTNKFMTEIAETFGLNKEELESFASKYFKMEEHNDREDFI